MNILFSIASMSLDYLSLQFTVANYIDAKLIEISYKCENGNLWRFKHYNKPASQLPWSHDYHNFLLITRRSLSEFHLVYNTQRVLQIARLPSKRCEKKQVLFHYEYFVNPHLNRFKIPSWDKTLVIVLLLKCASWIQSNSIYINKYKIK